MFLRLLPALAVCLATNFASAVQAETKLPCEVTPDNTSCSRIFACLGDQGRWFQGRAIGRGHGAFDGTTDDGVACHGVWTNQNDQGAGQADLTCDDGLTGTVTYTLQDGYTGTGIGSGTTNTGEIIDAWTGEHVLEFFRRNSPSAEALLHCGTQSIPIS